jgi:DNA-binding XRE family transcriptional regulator
MGRMETNSAERFGEAVEAARAARKPKRMTQRELATAAKVSLKTVWRLENGDPETPKNFTVHRAVAQALGWTPDSVEVVWAGGEPVLAVDGPATGESVGPSRALPAGLSERAKEALSTGRILDSDLISATPGQGGRRVLMILVDDDTPSEQVDISRDIERWKRMRQITDTDNFERLTRVAREIFSDKADGGA